MYRAEHKEDFLLAIGSRLQHAFDKGEAYTIAAQDPVIRFLSIDPPEGRYYDGGFWHNLSLPWRKVGKLPVEALVVRDDERKIHNDYFVVNDAGKHLGVVATLPMLVEAAHRCDVSFEPVPAPPAIDEPLSERYAEAS